jgi:hypothetical protein
MNQWQSNILMVITLVILGLFTYFMIKVFGG